MTATIDARTLVGDTKIDTFKLRLRRPQPATLGAVLALVVALTTALWAVGVQLQLNGQRAVTANLKERAARYDRVVAVLQAPDLQVWPMRGTQLAPTAYGRIYADPETGAAMIMVRSLPPLPDGRVYQVWWAHADGKDESGGVLTWTDEQGSGYALIQGPGPFKNWRSVSLTEEPVGGSSRPTSQALLIATV